MLSLAQKGTGSGLVIFWAPMNDTTSPPGIGKDALAAIGPGPTVITVNAHGAETFSQILLFAAAKTGIKNFWLAGLIGFSAGCQNVRAVAYAGVLVYSITLLDGFHSEFPPSAAQLAYGESLVKHARAGEIVAVITHTYIKTEPKFTSTRATAERATGYTLTSPEPHDVLTRTDPPRGSSADGWRGRLAVYSTWTAPDLAGMQAAHRSQAQAPFFPKVISEQLRDLFDMAEAPAGGGAALFDDDFPVPGAKTPAPAPTTVEDAPRVALIGDSLAQGLAPPLSTLAAAAGVTFKGGGIQSSTIKQWLAGLAGATPITKPRASLELISLGTNDMTATDAAAEGRRAGDLIDRIKQINPGDIAWIAPPSMPVDKPEFRAALAQACAARGVPIFDSTALDLHRAGDGIHPTPAGFAAWASAISAWIPLAGLSSSTPPADHPTGPDLNAGGGVGVPLGERAVLASLAEEALGVREVPAGSNSSPRIDLYGKPAGARGVNWCATGFCFAGSQALLAGEKLPHAYSARVATVVKSAGAAYHPKGSAYRPKLGDGAVFGRNGQDPVAGGDGHISRVMVVPNAAGAFRTIDANFLDTWTKDRERNTTEPEFKGWIEYPGGKSQGPEGDPIRSSICVDTGETLSIEAEYLPRVLAAEVGAAAPAALQAQAIAARTYLEHALRADRQLGTKAKPVSTSPKHFQAMAPATHGAIPAAAAAVTFTHGVFACWNGKLITAYYVAGAVWAGGPANSVPSPDPTKTEHLVTYNEGKTGAAVKAAGIGSPSSDNRGCMSQNGAFWLAKNLNYNWLQILQYFYGADLGFFAPATPPALNQGKKAPAETAPDPPVAKKGSDAGALALVGAALWASRLYNWFGKDA